MTPYATFYLLAIAVSAALMYQEGCRRGWKHGAWMTAVVAWVAAGVLGALLPRALLGDIAAARTCIGAVAAATIVLALSAWALRIPMGSALDSTVVAIPIGGAIARVGCFLAGCCQGTITGHPLGIASHPGELPRHPVQLYEASLELALAGVMSRRMRMSQRPGSAFIQTLGFLAAIRFVTEFARDSEKLGLLSLAQWIMLPAIGLCIAFHFARATHFTTGRRMPSQVAIALLGLCVGVAYAALGGLPPLEVSALLLIGTSFVAARAQRAAGSPTGLAVLALQIPIISSDSTFPRVYTSVGIGAFGGSYDFRHTFTDCESSSQWTRHHSFAGGALEVGARRQFSKTSGSGIRLRGYMSRENAGPATDRVNGPANPGPYSVRGEGISLLGDSEWKYLGISVGGTAGHMYPLTFSEPTNFNDGGPTTLFPAIGIRLGPLDAFSFEMRIGDDVPTWAPTPAVTLGVAVGDKAGKRLRVGVSEFGSFASGRIITRSGVELLPMLGLGRENSSAMLGGIQGSLMMRKWFRSPAKASPGSAPP